MKVLDKVLVIITKVLAVAFPWLPGITKVLAVAFVPLTVASGLFTFSVKYLPLTEHIIPWYPRYTLGQQGLKVLQEFNHPAKNENGQEIHVAVLAIDDPAWLVIWKFVQSEIAIRKSERNEPGPAVYTPPTPPDAQEHPKPVELPSIDFSRVKTIIAVKADGIVSVGSKPLNAAYNLQVLWPQLIPRRIYEFYSFKEFELDLKQMLVKELESGAALITLVVLLISVVLNLLKWALRKLEKRPTDTRVEQVVAVEANSSSNDR